jgi:hypothetical protein
MHIPSPRHASTSPVLVSNPLVVEVDDDPPSELPASDVEDDVCATEVEPGAPDEDELASPVEPVLSAGGSEKQAANSRHAHQRQSMPRVSHAKARCRVGNGPLGFRARPYYRRDMKIRRMYQNSSATAENSASAAATCWLIR